MGALPPLRRRARAAGQLRRDEALDRLPARELEQPDPPERRLRRLAGAGRLDPLDFIGTAFFAYSTDIVRRTAQILGHDDDAATYAALHDQIKAAFIARWVHADGTIGSGSQTSYVLALKFGLVPDELQSKAFERLTADVTGRGNHLSTGFLGTPFLLSVLQDGGRGDIAYELLTQDSYPSWGYMLGRYTAELGATVTITAGDAALSVHDPSATAPGHLINGEHVLPQALQARTASGFGPIAGASQPLTLTTWTAPVSNGPVTIGLKQPVAASDPLRTGGYAKTLTFTLSTTSP